MKGLAVVIFGGGAGPGARLAELVVEEGAAAPGIIDLNAQAAETALEPARRAGLPVAFAASGIRTAKAAHAALAAVAVSLGRVGLKRSPLPVWLHRAMGISAARETVRWYSRTVSSCAFWKCSTGGWTTM